MTMSKDELEAAVRLFGEAGQLKRSARSGWWRPGLSQPESVADHSWRTSVIAFFIALAEGADPYRAATIGTFHDLAEARTGDIEWMARPYVTTVPDEVITKDQVQGLPGALAEALLGVVREGEAVDTLEAQCARDADKLECLLQAREYQSQGYAHVQEWIDNMVAAVRTDTGKALARAALTTDPGEWWSDIASCGRA